MTFDAFDPRGWLGEITPVQSLAGYVEETACFAEPVAPPLANYTGPCEAGHGAGGRAPARRRPGPLDKKGNRISPEGETTAQRARRLRKVAAKWLHGVPLTVRRKGTVKRKDHAVVTCGSHAGYGVEVRGQKGVMIRKGQHGAFFGHAVTCGSVSVCPSCAGKIARVRCEQVCDSVDAHLASGGFVGMLTLTHGHRQGEALEPHLRALQKRWMAIKGGKSWQLFCERVGLRGGCTSREVTDGDHGWHPHLHILLFFAAGTTTLQVYEALQWITAKWLTRATKEGFVVSDRAQDFRLATNGKDAGEYVTKHGVEWEMTHSHLKRSKRGKTPWQMLEDGTPRDRARFVEYAKAMHGARMLTWFGDVFARNDEEDAQAVAEADRKAEDVALLDDDTYRAVVEKGLEDRVLRAAERGGIGAVHKLIKFLELGQVFYPDDGHRLGSKHRYPPGWNYQWKDSRTC